MSEPKYYGPCEACEGPATHVCHGPDVEPWRFCARHMKEHRDDCDDIAAGRALIEKLGEIA